MFTEVNYMHYFSVFIQLINLKVSVGTTQLVALYFTIKVITNRFLQSNVQSHLEHLSLTQSLAVGVQCEVSS